jgi:hypothetical protein
MEKVKVFVNFQKNEITIMTIEKLSIFEGINKSFLIEADYRGYSAIRNKEDGFHLINVLDGNIIEDKLISEEEAKKTIRDTIIERRKH